MIKVGLLGNKVYKYFRRKIITCQGGQLCSCGAAIKMVTLFHMVKRFEETMDGVRLDIYL